MYIKSRNSTRTATATKNELERGLFYGYEAVGNKVGKECFGAVGADKIAFEFLKAEGEALHIFRICTLAVEMAACVKLMEKLLGAVCYNSVIVSFNAVGFELWCIYSVVFGD